MTNEIKQDSRNYRKHGEKNQALINKSLSECGAGRSILTDSEGNIIAGNGIYEQAQKLNIPVKIVETDGSELVVVQRTDLKFGDEKRKRLAVMDNSASDTSEFDLEMLAEDFAIDDIGVLGVDIELNDIDWQGVENLTEDNYDQPEKKLIQCPKCGHVDSVAHFKNVSLET